MFHMFRRTMHLDESQIITLSLLKFYTTFHIVLDWQIQFELNSLITTRGSHFANNSKSKNVLYCCKLTTSIVPQIYHPCCNCIVLNQGKQNTSQTTVVSRSNLPQSNIVTRRLLKNVAHIVLF